MQTVQVNVNRSKLVNMLQALSYSDKMDIYSELKKTLFESRFDKLLKSLRTEELSLEAITETVDEVRQARYEQGRQCNAYCQVHRF